MDIEIDVSPEEIMTPAELVFVERSALALRRRLDDVVATSPFKAAIAGAVLGALYGLFAGGAERGESGGVFYAAAVGGVSGAALASTWRFFMAAGYGCGLCEGMSFTKFGGA